MMKNCSKCLIEKALTEFKTATHHKDGRTSQCRACINIRAALYREANREACRQRCRSWSKRNRQKENAKTKAYAKRNPGKVNALCAKRLAAKSLRTPKWLTTQDLANIQLFYIAAATMTLEIGVKFVVDHIVPLRGKNVSGLHVPWNLQVITAEDNVKKSNKFAPQG